MNQASLELENPYPVEENKEVREKVNDSKDLHIRKLRSGKQVIIDYFGKLTPKIKKSKIKKTILQDIVKRGVVVNEKSNIEISGDLFREITASRSLSAILAVNQKGNHSQARKQRVQINYLKTSTPKIAVGEASGAIRKTVILPGNSENVLPNTQLPSITPKVNYRDLWRIHRDFLETEKAEAGRINTIPVNREQQIYFNSKEQEEVISTTGNIDSIDTLDLLDTDKYFGTRQRIVQFQLSPEYLYDTGEILYSNIEVKGPRAESIGKLVESEQGTYTCLPEVIIESDCGQNSENEDSDSGNPDPRDMAQNNDDNMEDFNLQTFMIMIPEFDGDVKKLNTFILMCDAYYERLSYRGQQQFHNHIMIRLRERALDVFAQGEFEDWYELRASLTENLGSNRTVEDLQKELRTIAQNKNEKVRDYANRTRELLRELDEILARTYQARDVQIALREQNEIITARSFKNGLLQPLRDRMLSATIGRNLLDTINMSIAEEPHIVIDQGGSSGNFNRNRNTNNAGYNNKDNNRTNLNQGREQMPNINNNNTRRDLNTTGNNKQVVSFNRGNISCERCGRLGHRREQCYARLDNRFMENNRFNNNNRRFDQNFTGRNNEGYNRFNSNRNNNFNNSGRDFRNGNNNSNPNNYNQAGNYRNVDRGNMAPIAFKQENNQNIPENRNSREGNQNFRRVIEGPREASIRASETNQIAGDEQNMTLNRDKPKNCQVNLMDRQMGSMSLRN